MKELINIEQKVKKSNGELHNSCPYIDKIKDFLITHNANQELIDNLECVRAINDILRNTKSEKIDYDLIEHRMVYNKSTEKLEGEIYSLKEENVELLNILKEVSDLSPRVYQNNDYRNLYRDLRNTFDEYESDINNLKTTIEVLEEEIEDLNN